MHEPQNFIIRKTDSEVSSWKMDYLILFFIWPFFSLIIAIKNYKMSYAKNIVWMFTAFFGLTMVFVTDELDGARLVLNFEDASKHGLHAFQNFFMRDGYIDLLQPIVLYLVSCFTTDSHVMLGVLGLLFGYFYSRNVWFGIELLEGRLNKYAIVFIILLSLIIPIWEINGFRMWTAAQVFLFGVSRYFNTGKRKYAAYVILTPLIHFSFIFAVGAYFVFFLVKHLPLSLIFSFFIISVLVGEISLDIREYQSYAPVAYESKIQGYGNIEWAEKVRIQHQEMRWWAKYHKKTLEYFLIMAIIFAFLSQKVNSLILNDKKLWYIFAFSLWFTSLSRFLAALPFGDNYRFVIVANLFLTLSLIIIYGRHFKVVKVPFQYFISIVIISFYAFVEIRMGFDRMGIATFISNPFTVWLFEDTKPLIVFVKQLFGG